MDRRSDSPLVPDPGLLEDLIDTEAEPSDAFALPAVQLPDADSFGTLLFLTEPNTTLAVRQGRVLVKRPEQEPLSWPLAPLAAVVLLGRQRLTSGALQGLLGAGTPVHVADTRGRWLGATTPWPTPEMLDLWLLQRQRFADISFALGCAKAVVSARIRHQRENLRRRLSGTAAPIKALDQALGAAERCADIATLRGHEGNAARIYFAAQQDFIAPDLGFRGRARRPARDPYNALLSLGATILHSHVDLILRARGLLPTLGFYHQAHGRNATLASDLMEPVRHRVERVALGMLRRHQLQGEDFHSEASGAVRLSVPAKQRYIAALEREFMTPSQLHGTQTTGTLHDHLWQQSTSLMLALHGKSEFVALRYR